MEKEEFVTRDPKVVLDILREDYVSESEQVMETANIQQVYGQPQQ